MQKVLVIAGLLLACIGSWAVEFEQPGESSTCVISMKLALAPARPEDKTARAVVEVFLRTKGGQPIAGKEIQVTSSWGTFLCKLPELRDSTDTDPADDRSCFVTGSDGKVKINLINLLMNEAVQVKATCDCGDYFVHASGNLSVKSVKVK